MVEERSDQGGVEILEPECRRLLSDLLLRELEQQSKGVAVGRDGVGAGVDERSH